MSSKINSRCILGWIGLAYFCFSYTAIFSEDKNLKEDQVCNISIWKFEKKLGCSNESFNKLDSIKSFEIIPGKDPNDIWKLKSDKETINFFKSDLSHEDLKKAFIIDRTLEEIKTDLGVFYISNIGKYLTVEWNIFTSNQGDLNFIQIVGYFEIDQNENKEVKNKFKLIGYEFWEGM